MYIKKSVIAAALTSLTALAIIVAFLLGRQTAEPQVAAVNPPKNAALAPAQTAATLPVTAPLPPAAPVPAPPPPIALATLRDADIERLDNGCMCAFSVGKRTILEANDSGAIVRPNGELLFTPMPEGALQRMFDDRLSYASGGYSFSVRATGEVEPGFDGHSVPAELKVTRGQAQTRLAGTWGCAC